MSALICPFCRASQKTKGYKGSLIWFDCGTMIREDRPNNREDQTMRCRIVELDALRTRIKRLEESLDAMYEHNEEKIKRIKQLESENDAMRQDLLLWREAEVKP